MKQIKISKKIVISNETEAQTYNVHNLYIEYFKEYNYQLEFLGVPIDSNLPDPSKVIELLEGTYATVFGVKILQVSPFVDLNGFRLTTIEIRLTAIRFKRGMETPELTIYLITGKLELLESFGNTLILNNPSTESINKIFTVELDEKTTIYSYENEKI